jgi:Mechanosensitive ion channel
MVQRKNTVRFSSVRVAALCLTLLAGFSIAADTPATAPVSKQVSVITAEQVIQILDDTVDWYRTLGMQQQAASQPSDILILFANRQTANQVVSLAFDIARANAELLSSEANAAPSEAGAADSVDSFQKDHAQVESQLESVLQDLKKEGASKQASRDGEIAMLKARKNLLDTMADFVNESNPKGAKANALKAQIDAIAAAVPQLAVPTTTSTPPAATTTAAPSTAPLAATDNKPIATRSGIWELGTAVVNLKRKLKTIELIDQRTAALAKTFADFSAPSLKQLKAYTARSDALASQSGADAAAQKNMRTEFDTLAWLFKQTSDILLPLDKEQVLLQEYRRNLGNWRASVEDQYSDALSALGIRVGILLAILAAVFVLSEIWKRAVLRFAHEPRRRAQLLLVQRIVFWIAILSIIGLSFATEISTFATFAGLLTAGVAVAMQSVLVSVVGYFFLIGKYGIRVGDRIQIGTVVGEVIDIGLVRMHLMELNSTGPLGPTGRVVAFANLIVFQASGGLFKQIPGVNLSWHEITLNLPAVNDYAALKEKLQAALAAVLKDYQVEFSRQSREIERTTSLPAPEATNYVQMHLVDNRMVAVVRYPVHVENAAKIDEQVAEAVLNVIAGATEKLQQKPA